MNRADLYRCFIVWITVLCIGVRAVAQDGKKLFQQKCASCHGVDKDLTGPALRGMEARAGSKELLFAWIRNNQKVLKSGNKYYNDLYERWNRSQMNLYPDMSDEELQAITDYVENWQPAAKGTESKVSAVGEGQQYWIWGFVFLLAAGIIIFLLYINKQLRRISDKAIGLGSIPYVPFYRKKINVILAFLLVVGTITYTLANVAIEVGRDKGYMPRQPIFFSHKVHAGLNKVNCMFCHTGADKSKMSGIPSLQTCMTCHMGIAEYKGPVMQDETGQVVDGTAEIAKLYHYAGWNASKKVYDKPAQAIEWVRLHILPDHVYFTHENHVVNGHLQCQKCHGVVEEMDQMQQFSDLSMSWCVNCHRTEQTDFKNNAYYTMFERLHEDIRTGKIQEVTPDMLGANECQKCHY